MTFFSWRKDYEVGVAQIDAEHHGLFDLVNEFHDRYTQGDGRKDIPQMLNRLVAYAEEHFQHEEALMRENDYPQIDKHSEQHVKLLTDVFAINERFSSDPLKGSAEILQFVKNWLHDHILIDDMEIADFLARKASQAKRADEGKAADD